MKILDSSDQYSVKPLDTQHDEEQPNSFVKFNELDKRKSALIEDIDDEAKGLLFPDESRKGSASVRQRRPVIPPVR